MIDKAVKEIRKDEGYRQHVYADSEGIDTIGIGFNLSEGFTEEECLAVLNIRVENTLSELSRNIPYLYELPEEKIRVLINMCYQLGWPRLSKFKKMFAALEANDYEKAALEMLDSKWAKQTPNRAKRLAEIMRK